MSTTQEALSRADYDYRLGDRESRDDVDWATGHARCYRIRLAKPDELTGTPLWEPVEGEAFGVVVRYDDATRRPVAKALVIVPAGLNAKQFGDDDVLDLVKRSLAAKPLPPGVSLKESRDD